MQAPSQKSDRADRDDGGLMPLGVRRWVLGVLGVLVAGAVYLFAVRGPAILFDLTSAVAALCF